jgi:hypothetical protein
MKLSTSMTLLAIAASASAFNPSSPAFSRASVAVKSSIVPELGAIEKQVSRESAVSLLCVLVVC